MTPTIPLAAVGLLLIGLGAWGGRNAAWLPPASMQADERQRREYVLRRGAFSCIVMGVLCLVAAATIAF